MKSKKKRGTFGILVDLVLVICTGGLWGLMANNSISKKQ